MDARTINQKPRQVLVQIVMTSMIRKAVSPAFALAVLALIGILAPPAPAQAEATVRDIRISTTNGGAQVVIDLSREVSFRHITLADPPRLAIDLPEVAWLVPESFGDRADGLIDGFRFGRLRPGVSRLVVDMAQPFEIRNVVEIPPNDVHGHQIVTELVAIGAAAGSGALVNGTSVLPAPDGERDRADARRVLPDAPARTETVALPTPLRQPPKEKPDYEQRQPVIVIDPGHGGIDPGAIGRNGVYEKDIVLQVANELKRRIEATGRYRVVMTREDDSTVRLRERLAIARDAQGDLFLSLHADSLVSHPDVRGASVYTVSERASNDEAAALARKENRSEILSGVDLSGHEDIVTQILIDLAQRDANNKSIRLAETLVEELGSSIGMARKRRQQAGFVVLKSPDIPSALVELGYLSNPIDAQRLEDRAYQAQLSEAIVEAIHRFFTTEAS